MNIQNHWRAIDQDSQASGSPRTVVTHNQVMPFACRHCFTHQDFDCTDTPPFDKIDTYAAFLPKDLKTLTISFRFDL